MAPAFIQIFLGHRKACHKRTPSIEILPTADSPFRSRGPHIARVRMLDGTIAGEKSPRPEDHDSREHPQPQLA
jgi:hypothetical protein